MISEQHNSSDKDVLQSLLRCFALHTRPITDDKPSKQQRMTLVWRDNDEVHCQRYTLLMPWHPSHCAAQTVLLLLTHTSSHRTGEECIQSVPSAVSSPTPNKEAHISTVDDYDVAQVPVEEHYTLKPPSPHLTTIAQHNVHTNAPSSAPTVYLGAPLDATTIRHLLRRCHALPSKDNAHTTRNVVPAVTSAADLQALAALFPLLHNGALYCTAEAFINHCAHDDEHLFLCETLPWYPIHECTSQSTSNIRRREKEDGVTDSKAAEDKELSDAALPFFTTLYMTFMDAWEERVPQAKCTTTDSNGNDEVNEDDFIYNSMCDDSISTKENVITYEAHVGLWCGHTLSALLARHLTPNTTPSSTTTDEAFLISAANDDLLQLGPTALRIHGEMLRWWSELQTHKEEEEGSEYNALHAAATLWCAADNASANDMSNANMTPAQLNEARVRFFFSEVALLLATALVQQTRREEKSAAIAKAMAECAKEEGNANSNTIDTAPRSPSHASASLQSCSEGTMSYKRPRTDTTTNINNNGESEPSVLQRRNELLLFLLLHEPQTPPNEGVESATAT